MLPPSWIVLPVPYPCCSLPCVLSEGPSTLPSRRDVSRHRNHAVWGFENCKRGGAPRAQGSTASGPAQSCSDHAARFTDREWRGCSQRLERLAAQTSNPETLCVVRPRTPVSCRPCPTSAHRTQPSVALSAAPSAPLNSFLFFYCGNTASSPPSSARPAASSTFTLLHNRRHHMHAQNLPTFLRPKPHAPGAG